MKRLFLIIMMIVFVTGCVYSERRTPYGYSSGYSNYSTITPVYPRYQEQHYYIQTPRYVAPPAPYFRAYEERPEHQRHSHRRSHERENDNERGEHGEHNERSNSRSRQR